MIPKDEFKAQLKTKASNERLIELRENVHKLQVMSISQQDKYDNEVKRLDQSILKRTMDLDNSMQTIEQRVKLIEEDLEGEDEEGNSVSLRRSRASGLASGIIRGANDTGFGSQFSKQSPPGDGLNKQSGGEEDDNVNIGEAPKKVGVNLSLPNEEIAKQVLSDAGR